MREGFNSLSEPIKHPLTERILKLMAEKETNLALSADVTSAQELLQLADTIGPEICILKTHIDIIADFTPGLITQLRAIAAKHHFILFEDRKFADIGNTVKLQYTGGIYQIASWADLVNAHLMPGEGIVQGLKEGRKNPEQGLILLAELSSKGHMLNAAYQEKVLEVAEKHADFVIGFITQHALSQDPRFLNFTPGIQLKQGNDSLGQQYITPEEAAAKGTDVFIVGRGILHASEPVAAAREYRRACWGA